MTFSKIVLNEWEKDVRMRSFHSNNDRNTLTASRTQIKMKTGKIWCYCKRFIKCIPTHKASLRRLMFTTVRLFNRRGRMEKTDNDKNTQKALSSRNVQIHSINIFHKYVQYTTILVVRIREELRILGNLSTLSVFPNRE